MIQIEKHLQEFTDSMVKNLPKIVSASIVDLLDGNVLAYKASDYHTDNKEVSSYQSDVVKYALKGLDHIDNLKSDKFENITITLDHQIHIIYPSEQQRVIVYIIMQREGANLALAEVLKNKLYKEVLAKLQSESSPEELLHHPLLKHIDILHTETDNSDSDNLSEKQKSNNSFFRKIFSN